VSGDSLTAGRVAQALLGVAVVALIALIGVRLFGRDAGLIAGALAAIFPPLVIDGLTLLSEPLFVTFQLSAVLAALYAVPDGRPRLRLIALAGVLAGGALLTRSTGVVLLPALALLVRTGPWRRLAGYRAPALLVACALLCVVPWTVRNTAVMDAFVPLSTQGGYTLAGTYNEVSRARHGFWLPANVDPAYARIFERNPDADEVELGGKLGAKARRFALDHPGYVGDVVVHNAARLFNLAGIDYARIVARGDYGLGPDWAALMAYGSWPFFALALAGAFMPAARRAPWALWLMPLLMLTTLGILATNRFRAPIDPFILLLAALAVDAARRRFYRAASPTSSGGSSPGGPK
jgi:4-amino-4-deoxy-L-arabinose transferase-like glycosyltransferase